MDKKLKPEKLPKKFEKILDQFFDCYREATGGKDTILDVFVQLIQKQLKDPYSFEPHHKKMAPLRLLQIQP